MVKLVEKMAKIIPLFGGQVNGALDSRIVIELAPNEVSGDWHYLVAYPSPVSPIVYVKILSHLGSQRNCRLIEINSDGSSFLITAAALGKSAVAVSYSDLWVRFNQGLTQRPDLPLAVISLQSYSSKPVSLSGYSEHFKPFFSGQTFADLCNFKSFLTSLPEEQRQLVSYVVALILHGNGAGYLSSPTTHMYSPNWQEHAKFVVANKAYPQDRDIVSRVLKRISQLYTIRGGWPTSINCKSLSREQFYKQSIKGGVVFVNLVKNPLSAPSLQWLRCWWFSTSIASHTKFWEGITNTDHAVESIKLGNSSLEDHGDLCILTDLDEKEIATDLVSKIPQLGLKLVHTIDFLPPKTALGKRITGFRGISCLVLRRL